MKNKISLILVICLSLLCGCEQTEKDAPIFSGRVEYFYYKDYNDSIDGFTRYEKGLPGTSTMAKEDVWLDVYEDWVMVTLRSKSDYTYIVPKERVVKIVVGTEKGNNLNIPK